MNTGSGVLLSLRGGSTPSSPLFTKEGTPSSPLFTEEGTPSSTKRLSTDKDEDGDDDAYVPLVQNQNFILALYLAAGLEIPEGMSPPQDRSIIRHGIRAYELLRGYLSERDLEDVVKPVLLVPDGDNAVARMHTILQSVAVKCMKDGRLIFPSDEDIDDGYASYTQRVDCSELMSYLMSILVWVVSDYDVYYRLGFERVYWKVKLYKYIWRHDTLQCLEFRNSRPRRERGRLYGKKAQDHVWGEMKKCVLKCATSPDCGCR